MFSWFNAGEAKKFAASLAAFYIERVPASGVAVNDKKFAAKTQATLATMSTRAREFVAQHPLNGYKKAQLCNTFKWALKDAGYDDAYIDKMTDWLLLQL